VNAASLALMVVVTSQLGGAALIDWLTVILLITGIVLLIRLRINSAWLVLGGALFGLLILVWNKI
jgi:chromate transporter